MNILAVNNFNPLRYLNNDSPKYQKYPNYANEFQSRNLQPLQHDTVSFGAAKLGKTMIFKQPSRFERIGNVYLDVLESIALSLKDCGVSFNRDYCKLNVIKSGQSCCSKIARSSSLDIRDRIRATLFAKDITNMAILNKILNELNERGFVLAQEEDTKETFIPRGTSTEKKNKKNLPKYDLDVRLSEGKESMMEVMPNLIDNFGKPQKSGYEDIQLRLIRMTDNNENPVKHELIIITGENYAIAKHIEYEHIYKYTRQFDELNAVKRNPNNENVKIIKRYIDLVRQLCSTEISQKLFENAKNKDVYNIDTQIPIKITQNEINSLQKYFEEIQIHLEKLYEEIKSKYPSDSATHRKLNKDKKSDIELLNNIQTQLSQSIRKLNKGKYPKTMDELVKEIEQSKKAVKKHTN